VTEALGLSVSGGCELRGELPLARLECESGRLEGELRFVGLGSGTREVFVQLDDGEGRRAVLVRADAPSLRLEVGHQVRAQGASYLQLGMRHIAGGLDHLLFVFLLTLAHLGGVGGTSRQRTRALLWGLTGFTLAHSLTLAAAALGWVETSQPWIEAWIAGSLVLASSEIVRSWRRAETASLGWKVACAFGLVHGLGFAGALGELGLPQEARWRSLLAFNVGIELGQLAVVAILWVVWRLTTSEKAASSVAWDTWPRLLPLYAVGTVASAWMIERAFMAFA
jgi:hypothetical protein